MHIAFGSIRERKDHGDQSLPLGPAWLRLFNASCCYCSKLVDRENGHILRGRVRQWLDRFEDPSTLPFEDMPNGRVFAEFLADLVRVGAGLRPSWKVVDGSRPYL